MITLVFTLTIMAQLAFSQVSNVVEGSKWKEVRCNYWTGVLHGIYHVDNWRIEGDTIFNGVVYKKIYNYQEDYKHAIIHNLSKDSLISATDYFYGGIREDDQKVYIYSTDFYEPDSPLSEKLMFDYSASVGDTVTIWCRYYYLDYIIEEKQSVLMNDGKSRNKFILRPPGPGIVDMSFIEGIGSSYGIIGSYIASTNDQMQHLLCFSINDTIIVENTPEYTSNCLFEPIQESCNTIVLNVEDKANSSGFLSVYPNPITTELFIETTNNQVNLIAYKLYNLTGSLILSSESISDDTHSIDVSMVPSGVYFLAVNLDNSETIVKRIVVAK